MNCSQHQLIFKPHPVELSRGGTRREPTRSVSHRPPNFADQFDYYTLLFDCFFISSTKVIITAPSFFNLASSLRRMVITTFPSATVCSFRIRNLERHSQIHLSVPQSTTAIRLDSELGQFVLRPHRNHSHFFDGKRVIFTLSKNNRLEWIVDWVRFNRDIHGANAVLLYDNASTDYSVDHLANSLGKISGIERLCIVSWPFLYGPQGLDAKNFWDSDFCQYGAWEHARWMFLQHARSVMNSDIDELVISRSGVSVFAAAERSLLGIIRYRGNWVHGFIDRTRVATAVDPIRVVDFDHYLRHEVANHWRIRAQRQNICPPKWTVVPSKCPDHAQWAPHRIRGWLNSLSLSHDFTFRHFREIGNHWKYDRSSRETFDSTNYVHDERMCADFARVNWTS